MSGPSAVQAGSGPEKPEGGKPTSRIGSQRTLDLAPCVGSDAVGIDFMDQDSKSPVTGDEARRGGEQLFPLVKSTGHVAARLASVVEDPVSQFRRRAREAREMADRADDDRQRDALHDIALHWESLADLWRHVSRRSRDRT